MSHGMFSDGVLSSNNYDYQVSMTYTSRVIPVHTVITRHCRCTHQSFTLSPPGGTLLYLDSVDKSNRSHLLGVDKAGGVTSLHWRDISEKRSQESNSIAEFLEEDNQKEEEEEEEEEEEMGRPHGLTAGVMDVSDRIPTIEMDQEAAATSRLVGRLDKTFSQSGQSLPPPPPPPPPSSPAGFNSSRTPPLDHRRLSSAVSEKTRHPRPAGASGQPSPAGGKNARPWSLEIVFLTVALLFITPVSGGFDRGGPQHRITWGRGNSPPGSAVFGNSPTNVTAVVGHRARLPCQVKNLGLKDVSWIRQRDLHILTVGIFTYTSDDRFKVFHPHETEDWFLDISSVTFRDSGIYECQVSTSPKVSLPINLTVLGVQEADIPGPNEVFIQHGSTISLQCEVQAGVEAVGPVRWLKGAATLNYSSPRGGISMEVEKTPTKTMSKLYITRAVRPDSGNYTCAPLFAKPDSVLVHVVNAGEESAAAVHSGSSSQCNMVESILIWVAALLSTSWLFLNLSSTRP